MQELDAIKQRFTATKGLVDERARRLIAAAESLAIGRGGIAVVSRATGLSRQVIRQGVAELRTPDVQATPGVRRSGGGRKKAIVENPALLLDLERLVGTEMACNPASALRWTCKSLRTLAGELQGMGHKTSHRMVGDLLLLLRYSVQPDSKSRKATMHPDRDAQFNFLNQKVGRFSLLGLPVVAVQTSRKKLAGDNPGTTESGPASIHGTPEPGNHSGWTGVRIDQDTAGFGAENIGHWWHLMGQSCFPKATELLIVADLVGSTGFQHSLWKLGLQRLADTTGLGLTVCHFPPGTYQWNKVDHRLLSRMEQDVPGTPLVRHEVVVNLIGAITAGGAVPLRPAATLHKGHPPKPDARGEDIARLELRRDKFHGEWNYTIYRKILKN